MMSIVSNKIREWGFPVALIVSWVIASGYTVSQLVEAKRSHDVAAVTARA
jgi:hypothetical protein